MNKIILLLLLGMSLSLQAQDSVFVFQKKAPLPGLPRADGASFLVDSTLYIVGGGDSIGGITSEVYRYDISSNVWTRLLDFPGGQVYANAGFSIAGKGYIFGGDDSVTQGHTALWEYDPATNNWTRKSDFTDGDRYVPSSFAYAGKGYIAFGRLNKNIWQYDPIADHWQKYDSLATGRYGTPVVMIDSTAYFVAGYNSYGNKSINELWAYHILSKRWDRLSDVPGPTRGFSAAWGLGDFLLCGYGAYSDSTGVILLKDKYLYDIKHDRWKQVMIHGFVDSIAEGLSFQVGNVSGYFGGAKMFNPTYSFYNDIWTTDLSSLLITAIDDIDADKGTLATYPNPVSAQGILHISTTEPGDVSFYNAIGQQLYTTRLDMGINSIPCTELRTAAGMIFYTTTMKSGKRHNGKVVISE